MICLSSGNYDGLGQIRELELKKVGLFFGFQDVKVVDDPLLQDGMQEKWPKERVGEQIGLYIDSIPNGVDLIITFDKDGVSSHPNHKDVYQGVMHFFNQKSHHFDLMTLQSVNIVLKYTGYIGALMQYPFSYTFYPDSIFDTIRALQNHESQLVWYRILFTFFSRYAFINTFDFYHANTNTMTIEYIQ
ncbi:n-acetyl-d-glucosaminylphosphatidylinos itol de-n-acetylase [Stylonychia lemnae]|uniref:N-acetylglucosaminylphosphatidylinositol deacetylase n=1 Tax=Stylonychia lemnae TaxID=5949 RepID=A0A078AFP4_STYLE|nr:n-acetyl-d-glucosaminylphosphatidylinos itol de-n-acetylase [Stylonychia lemnae]|eukprot:CDW80656.1 n-acetyl-d-glucosaminylphosphatidylinos itol de-n-acetylase [Stylonychia lemnae]